MLDMIGTLTSPYNGNNLQVIADRQLFSDRVEIGNFLAGVIGSNDLTLARDAFGYLEDGHSLAETYDFLGEQLSNNIIVIGQGSFAEHAELFS
jgi:hypothetical protein